METESLSAPDAEGEALRDLGHATDMNEGRPVEQPAAETPETTTEAPEPTPEPQPPPPPQRDGTEPEDAEPIAAEQRPRDPVTGKFQKPDTEYSKAQKEQVRINRTWQNIQAEKEQIRTEKAQWEEHVRMQQLQAARQQYQPIKKDGLTAQEYYEGAVRFDQEGDHENALKAYKVASELGRAEQERYAQMQEVEAEYQWRVGMEEATKLYPDIWNTDSKIQQHLQRIIAEHGDTFYRMPQGFQRATEIANMLTHEGLLKEKDDEIVALKAQLEKYQRKGQPARGGYAAPRTGDKEFDEMNLDEMESHLKGLTAEADHWR